ncbi:hypothetical protein K32_08810 [Kaistia sp. 32K]|uniref:TolB family protein n=1 Tax=Kaistia sp. 32K TaxID=2795690 RepID=UPI0019160CAC|nr:PD40 domain-containing protein [Kaistia sp. 32K]BCP52264.1 hypothetical protein K32_08810 [Kaistia sp. 32K]
MANLSRRKFFGSVAATAVTAATLSGGAATQVRAETSKATAGSSKATLVPRKFPFLPNDEFGNYEPTISADGNTIYFARWASPGDKRVTGPSDIFVTHRTNTSREWPGNGEDWSAPERLPDEVNSASTDLEPWISEDGNTLYFMSSRPEGGGKSSIWETHKQADGGWTKAQLVAGGNINTEHGNHCFMPFDLPGQVAQKSFISGRPREDGGPSGADIYTTQFVDGAWQPAKRYESRLLDSIALKCRLNVVTQDDFTLGVVSVHDFGKFHTLLFVHYDPTTQEWKGPVVEAPFNDWNIDGACPNFQHNGERMIWSAGYDRGPDLISGRSDGAAGVYDLFWLPTSEIIAFYKANAGLA